jgi:hypothetical protein
MKTIRWGIIGYGNVTEIKSGPGASIVLSLLIASPLLGLMVRSRCPLLAPSWCSLRPLVAASYLTCQTHPISANG